MKEIEAIKQALAAGPTPGPWIGAGPSFGQPLPVYLNCVVPDYEDGELPVTVCDNTETADANYIAACNPAAMTTILAHIDAQAAEIERLRADAERYKYLRSAKSRNHNNHSQRALVAGVCDFAKNLDPDARFSFWTSVDLTDDELDAAIDAAVELDRAQPERKPHTEAEVQALIDASKKLSEMRYSDAEFEQYVRRILGVPKQ